MNLKHLTDETLHSETHRLNREQNNLLIELLHHLRENERRRLFSKFKYSSLEAYVQAELKYSGDEAARRISAMRLLRDVPEIEPKIASGDLSLTNLVLARTLFRKEKKAGRHLTQETKKQILARMENQPVRVAQKIVAEINPEMKKKDTFNFAAVQDDLLREKLLQLQGLYAQHGSLNLTELLHKICDEQLAILKSKKTQSPAAARITSKAEISRQVWQRDECKCSNCGSTFAVQEDHRIPAAVGGEYNFENIRLLCRSCNQRAAIEFYGVEKISGFLDGDSSLRSE